MGDVAVGRTPGSLPDAFPEVPETVYGVKKRLNFIYDALQATPQVTILDVGCGSGELLSIPLAQRGFSITGVDSDEKSLDHARALAAEHGLSNIAFASVHSMETLEPVDVVIASEVIEHVGDPVEFLNRLRERLRPHGLLILTLPNGRGPFEIDQWLWRHNLLFIPSLYYRLEGRVTRLKERRGISRPAATCNEHDPHVNFFTWGRINRLLQDAGFKVERFQPRTLVAGSFASIFVQVLGMGGLRCQRLLALNASLAERLPPQVSSDWMFVCRRDASG